MTAKTGNDDIIFVGLNKTAIHEANALRKQGNNVIFIGPGSTPDFVTFNGKQYNLGESAQLERFLKTLSLSPQQLKGLNSAINTTGSNIKDELCKLVGVLAKMEKTHSGPGRMVLSSHGTGSYFWGTENGGFFIKKFEEIIPLLPKAASLIEDLHLAACYAGKELYVTRWRKLFPNVSTIWGYHGSAPGTFTGAQKHLFLWSTATRGNKIKLDLSIAKNTRKGKEVAVWSKYFGYQFKGSSDLNDLINRITSAEPMFQSHFRGETIVRDTQSGPLRAYYNDLQEVVGHELAGPAQVRQYRTRLEITIRLIYFEKAVKKKFMSTHGGVIKRAYKILMIKMPDYSKLDRKACLHEIGKFSQAAERVQSDEVQQALILLVQGLKDLDSAHIPANWI